MENYLILHVITKKFDQAALIITEYSVSKRTLMTVWSCAQSVKCEKMQKCKIQIFRHKMCTMTFDYDLNQYFEIGMILIYGSCGL